VKERASRPLSGGTLWLAGLILGLANFMVVLDTTIANVSVPSIAGGLGAPPNQGTWVITSYAVAEAITIPLTGWLTSRFGAVRVFVTCMLGFGAGSLLCGLASSLPMLALFRVLQGLCGGPLLALSQILLLRVFPPRLASAANGLWGVTLLVGPILGPILGGVICDSLGWPSIFFINLPIALGCAALGWRLLASRETPTAPARIDLVGLGLLVAWVGALQIMLDLGKNHDWFQSPLIVALAAAAMIAFLAFLVWELTEVHPIVALSAFRKRGFAVGVATTCVGFAAFFGVTVITPLWLQQNMGYTASAAGYVTALTGVLAVLAAPFAAGLSGRTDARALVFVGVLWLAVVTFARAHLTPDMTFGQVGLGLLLQGAGVTFFLLPLSDLTLANVDESEMAHAAGLLSFCRTLAGAAGASVATTLWESQARRIGVDLAAGLPDVHHDLATLIAQGLTSTQALAVLRDSVTAQSQMIATNQIFLSAAGLFAIAALMIWLAPIPRGGAAARSFH
jgi:DHA2 family multidrug resistance protein